MSNDAEAQITLASLLLGGVVSQMVAAIAKVGIPAQLADGAKSAEELAHTLELQVEPTYRLLRGLTVYGVVEESDASHFSLTTLGRQLLPDAANSLHPLARLVGESFHARSFLALESCLRSGKSGFLTVHGLGIFDWLAQHPRETAVFANAMEGFSAPEVELIVAAWDFASARRIADIGGGSGKLLAGILRAHPSAHGLLIDQESVLAEARQLLQREAVLERCELCVGSFFAELPGGCDTYLLKHVLHDWSDERARAILLQVASAMTPSSTLLIIEQVMSDAPDPEPAKFLDVFMLALTEGGRERTHAQHRALLESAGLRLEQLVTTASPLRLIVARLAER